MSFIEGLQSLGKTIAGYAPELGKILPIPGGEILGKIVAKTFGGDITKPDELAQIISQDPQAAIKLIEIQNKHVLDIYNLELQAFIEENSDKASARNREIQLAIANKDKPDLIDNTPRNLAYMLMFGFFGFLFSYAYLPFDSSDKDILSILAGVLTGKFSSAVDYFLGSSFGSRLKDFANQKYNNYFAEKPR